MRIKSFILILVLWSTVTAEQFSDFAVTVVDFGGDFFIAKYDDPNAVIGMPATICKNIPSEANGDPFRVKLIEPAYNLDANDQKVLVWLFEGDYVTVKFDHKVVDFGGNLYGKDFIVFGNSFFRSNDGHISDGGDINYFPLTTGIYPGTVKVSVSQDGQIWHSFENGPYADGLFPTQAFEWDREIAQWTDELMDFTQPIDPNLTTYDFEYIYAADAIDLYEGSGGGTAYDLEDLADYQSLAIDANTNCRWIQYIRFDGYDIGGQIDAVSDVAACGDPTHPYPVGDINRDCRVDWLDMAELGGTWLDCTYDCD